MLAHGWIIFSQYPHPVWFTACFHVVRFFAHSWPIPRLTPYCGALLASKSWLGCVQTCDQGAFHSALAFPVDALAALRPESAP